MPVLSREQCIIGATLLASLIVLRANWRNRRNQRHLCRANQNCELDSKIFRSCHFSELLCDLACANICRCLSWSEIIALHRADRFCARMLCPVDVWRQMASFGYAYCNSATSDIALLLETNEIVNIPQVIDAALATAALGANDLTAALAITTSQGRAPLLLAVQRRHHKALEILLKMGAPPDIGDVTSGWSPLMFAITARDEHVAQLLVSHGASVNYVARPHGYTPLLAALGMCNEFFIEWLLDCGVDPSYTISTLHANLAHFGKEYELLRRVLASRPKGSMRS